MPANWPNPSRVYRNASWTGGGSETQIIFDAIDPASPYTRLSSGSVVINRPGWVTVTAQATYGSLSIRIHLKINGGSDVAQGEYATTSSLSYTYLARAGDSLGLWENDQLANQAGGTGINNTFLRVAPVRVTPAPNLTHAAISRAAVH